MTDESNNYSGDSKTASTNYEAYSWIEIRKNNAVLLENPPKPSAQDISGYDWIGRDNCGLVAQDGTVIRFALFFILSLLCVSLNLDKKQI